MPLAVGAVSSSTNNMGFDTHEEEGQKSEEVDLETETKTSPHPLEGKDEGAANENLGKHMCEADEEEDDERESTVAKIQLGPQCTLKEHIEKDKDDESLRKWKEQLLGSVDFDSIGETVEPEVKILSLTIVSPERSELILPIPEGGKPKGSWFTLKEGSHYSFKLTFEVNNNIVSGLKYTNTVWKAGIKVDSAQEMLGTFSPQPEPYIHVMPEETTPSGMFARGSYSARTKFIDDDNKCYLEINYTFEIRKDWSDA